MPEAPSTSFDPNRVGAIPGMDAGSQRFLKDINISVLSSSNANLLTPLGGGQGIAMIGGAKPGGSGLLGWLAKNLTFPQQTAVAEFAEANTGNLPAPTQISSGNSGSEGPTLMA